MNWKQIISGIMGTGKVGSTENRDDFEKNRITVQAYSDAYPGGGADAILGLTAAWACINLIAGTGASMPCMVYRKDTAGNRVAAKEHQLYRVLHDSPNADQTSLDFWEFMLAAVELRGNAYAEIIRGTKGQVIGLQPIMTDSVRCRRADYGDLEYQWRDGGRTYEATQREVFHIRGFGGGPLGGASTLSVCSSAFSSAQVVERAASQTFANGARPSGILSTDAQLTKEQRIELEQLLQGKFVGAINAGRPMLLDRAMTWQQLTINPDDAQMLESRKFSGEEICRIFGVPPAMVGYGDKASNWGTGKEVDVLGFQKFTLRRRLKRVELAAQKQLLSPADLAAGVTIEFNLEGLLRGDSTARASFYQSGLQNGWTTINEVRALENLPPVEGGDVPRMQMQNVPLTAEVVPPTLPAPAP